MGKYDKDLGGLGTRPMTAMERLTLAHTEKDDVRAGLRQIRKNRVEGSKVFKDEKERYLAEKELHENAGVNTGDLRRVRDRHDKIVAGIYEADERKYPKSDDE